MWHGVLAVVVVAAYSVLGRFQQSLAVVRRGCAMPKVADEDDDKYTSGKHAAARRVGFLYKFGEG